MAPVTNKFNKATGNNIFQPYSMSWSYRGRGNEARSKTKNRIKTNVLRVNQTSGGRNPGPSHPPKNKVTTIAEISVMPRYSPIKNIPNFIPEYSEWKPATSSLS